MHVLCEVYNVRVLNGQKLKAEVSLIVQHPDDIIRLRLFEAHERQGLISAFQKLQGKQIKVPLEPDIYQGKINFSLSYAGTPEPV